MIKIVKIIVQYFFEYDYFHLFHNIELSPITLIPYGAILVQCVHCSYMHETSDASSSPKNVQKNMCIDPICTEKKIPCHLNILNKAII